MNYPLWDLPAPGLLIALVAVTHVFVSHFAVGGGLYLVLAERKARRENDAGMLDWVRHHSRFFILLTLVFGAISGVGIWVTIALVHPQATSSLINTFVWGWALEWCFFVMEIAAAMVYYYGWDRLSARAHEAVGWIYFIAAEASLVIINGIISYQMTAGRWVETRAFWDGFFNPTYWPSTFLRTLLAMGIAGVYALLTARHVPDGAVREKIARWTTTWWVLPATVGVAVSLVWYFHGALAGGVPAGEILGAKENTLGAVLGSIFSFSHDSGYPPAILGAQAAIFGSVLVFLLAIVAGWVRPRTYCSLNPWLMVLVGLLAMGGGEFVREDLRKPWVIDHFMFVNSVRLPAPPSVPRPPAGAAEQVRDRFDIPTLDREGVLRAALWTRLPPGVDLDALPAEPAARAEAEAAAGREVFRLLCSQCHTIDGYLAIRPLVTGKKTAAIEGILGRLAKPVDAQGNPTTWDDPHLRLVTWRHRRMPPFVGTPAEKHALAVWLARLGGDQRAGMEAPPAAAGPGPDLFEAQCAMCHGPDGDWPLLEKLKGRPADELYEQLGRLPEINDMMPAFEGTDAERRALAEFLAAGGVAPVATHGGGAAAFEAQCAMCHGPDGDWPLLEKLKGRPADELYEQLGRLPEINDMMPAFEGTDAERRALAEFLAAGGDGQ